MDSLRALWTEALRRFAAKPAAAPAAAPAADDPPDQYRILIAIKGPVFRREVYVWLYPTDQTRRAVHSMLDAARDPRLSLSRADALGLALTAGPAGAAR